MLPNNVGLDGPLCVDDETAHRHKEESAKCVRLVDDSENIVKIATEVCFDDLQQWKLEIFIFIAEE